MTIKDYNHDQFLDQTKISEESDMNTKNMTIEEIQTTFGISGVTKVKINKETTTGYKADRFSTKSFEIDLYLYEHYKLEEEFVTQKMSKYFREQGWKTSDISGQLYSKKNAELMINRPPTDEEAEQLGKNISIWQLTTKFFEKMEEEMVAYEEYLEHQDKVKSKEETE